MTDNFAKEIIERLKKEGYKLTPQRLEVIKAVYTSAPMHPAMNEIYKMVKQKLPTISFSTLYSIIKKLQELGYIKLFDLNGETRIEAKKQPHINIINADSGQIFDFDEPELIATITKKLRLENKNFLVNIIIYNKKVSSESPREL